MTALGNVGNPNGSGALYTFSTFQSQSGNTQYHTDMTATSAIPNAIAILVQNSTYVDKMKADGSGIWHFYDMDDSLSYPYVIYTTDQFSGAIGEIWLATIVLGVVTITKLFSNQRGGSFAFT